MPKNSPSEQMDWKGLEIIADEFTGSLNGTISGDVDADQVNVEAYLAGGIAAGNLQTVLNALADRIDDLENP